MKVRREGHQEAVDHEERVRTIPIHGTDAGEVDLQDVGGELEQHPRPDEQEDGPGSGVRLAKEGHGEAQDQDEVAQEVDRGERCGPGAKGIAAHRPRREVPGHGPAQEHGGGVQPELDLLAPRPGHAGEGQEPEEHEGAVGQVEEARDREGRVAILDHALEKPEGVAERVAEPRQGQEPPGSPRLPVEPGAAGRTKAERRHHQGLGGAEAIPQKIAVPSRAGKEPGETHETQGIETEDPEKDRGPIGAVSPWDARPEPWAIRHSSRRAIRSVNSPGKDAWSIAKRDSTGYDELGTAVVDALDVEKAPLRDAPRGPGPVGVIARAVGLEPRGPGRNPPAPPTTRPGARRPALAGPRSRPPAAAGFRPDRRRRPRAPRAAARGPGR